MTRGSYAYRNSSWISATLPSVGRKEIGSGSSSHETPSELRPDEACFLPAGSAHEYRNYAGSTATAVIGVAPRFLPENAL